MAPSPDVSVRLTSLAMKPGAPPEWMLSKRGRARRRRPRSATSPREFTAGARMSPRNTHPYLPAYSGKTGCPVADDARAVALRDEEAEVDVAADGHARLPSSDQRARLFEPRLELGDTRERIELFGRLVSSTGGSGAANERGAATGAGESAAP